MNILCVAAHPDDEVLGCGGTLRRHVEEGDQVYVAFMGSGVGARGQIIKQGEPGYPGTHGSNEGPRYHEARKALDILGVPHTQWMPYHVAQDNQFDAVPILGLIKSVEGIIEGCHPDIIYTHHHTDLNIDHSLTAKAVITATRPKPGCRISQVLAMESISSLEWGFGVSEWKPDHFVELNYLQVLTKHQALHCYQSELMERPHPRSQAYMWDKARACGPVIGVEYAEAFQVLRTIRYLGEKSHGH